MQAACSWKCVLPRTRRRNICNSETCHQDHLVVNRREAEDLSECVCLLCHTAVVVYHVEFWLAAGTVARAIALANQPSPTRQKYDKYDYLRLRESLTSTLVRAGVTDLVSVG